MKQPMQPVCVGVDEKGELIWKFVPMPRWQQAMFPVRYVGDFIGFWFKQIMFQKTGLEGEDIPSMDIQDKYKHLRKPRPQHSGD